MNIIWPGEAGDSYTNNTGKVVYQVQCQWHNTCGACAQYHDTVVDWWSPLHHGCACVLIPIFPNGTSKPYEDWQKIIQDLPESQQKEIAGASNWKLIQEGVVDFGDVVTSTRVRSLQEVVSREKLTVDQMTEAGIRASVAEKAWATVNTPEHILADQTRAALFAKIKALGVTPQTLADMFGAEMAERIGIAAGPSGPSGLPPIADDTGWVKILMKTFSAKAADTAKAIKTYMANQLKKPQES